MFELSCHARDAMRHAYSSRQDLEQIDALFDEHASQVTEAMRAERSVCADKVRRISAIRQSLEETDARARAEEDGTAVERMFKEADSMYELCTTLLLDVSNQKMMLKKQLASRS